MLERPSRSFDVEFAGVVEDLPIDSAMFMMDPARIC
jgi:hypothetical protein